MNLEELRKLSPELLMQRHIQRLMEPRWFLGYQTALRRPIIYSSSVEEKRANQYADIINGIDISVMAQVGQNPTHPEHCLVLIGAPDAFKRALPTIHRRVLPEPGSLRPRHMLLPVIR